MLSITSRKVRGVLLDIEGTVTPIAFVHEVLFPYARAHLRDYLTAHYQSDEVLADIAELRAEQCGDVEQHLNPPALEAKPTDAEIDSIVSYVNWLIDRDRKSTGLKSLQGKIWQEGYANGALLAPLFADVSTAMRRWQDAGLKVSIFSSGSALAQQQLFAHTNVGDLRSLIDGYFDTTIGAKGASESYRTIASSLVLPAEAILFISDVVTELDAARDAGMQTHLCIRPGNAPQREAHGHPSIQSFDEVLVFELE
jgi:enolase-phosphatase E1